MDLKVKKVLVTGGAGFIGSHLVDALSAANCDVRVLDDLSTGHLSNLRHVENRISFYKGDIRDQDILTKASKCCDAIFHQAAVVSVPRTIENPVDSALVNDMGTLFVLEAARKNKVKRVVLASSCAVYGDDPEVPKQENMIPNQKARMPCRSSTENIMRVSILISMVSKRFPYAILMFTVPGKTPHRRIPGLYPSL